MSNTVLYSQTNYNFNDKLVAFDRSQGDEYGTSVHISGNYAIVGAPKRDNNTGAAYIYKKDISNNTWLYQEQLIASDAASGDQFGHAVSIDGNTGYAVVGAYKKDDGSGNADVGAAYVFELVNNAWSEVSILTAPSPFAEDHFGWSVSISNNLVLIGVPGFDVTAPGNWLDAGTAHLFERQSGTWSYLTELPMQDANSGDEYGYAVAVDGYTNRLVIGAWHEDNSNLGGSNTLQDAGSAYVYHKYTNYWYLHAKVVPSDRKANDHFGAAVAISPTNTQIVIGAPLQDYEGLGSAYEGEAGAVYLYSPGQIGVYTNEVKLTAIGTDRQADDQFGISVSLDGDRLAVGAWQEDFTDQDGLNDQLNEAGATYLFEDQGGATWVLSNKLTPSPDRQRLDADYFGNAVAISGNSVIAAAYLEDEDEIDNFPSVLNAAGSVYIFEAPCNPPTINLIITDALCNGVNDGAIVSQYNSNGNPSPVIYNWSNGATSANLNNVVPGSYTLTVTAANGCSATATAVVNSPGGTNMQLDFNELDKRHARESDHSSADYRFDNKYFGSSVDISGGFAIVGDQYHGPASGTFEDGSAYIFQKNAGSWQQIQRIQAPIFGDQSFGNTVAIDGNTAVVGAPAANLTATTSGEVYIYERNTATNTWILQGTIVNNTKLGFGDQVDISGDNIIVSSNVSGIGAVDIYNRSNNWGHVHTLVAQCYNVFGQIIPNGNAGDNFGRAIAIDGNTIIVGAPHQGTNPNGAYPNGTTPTLDAGGAYIYSYDGAAWSLNTKITAPPADMNQGDLFGTSVAISGNLIAIGSVGDNSINNIKSGAVHIFEQVNNDWNTIPSIKLFSNNPVVSDQFGYDVSLSGNYLLVGTPYRDFTGAGTDDGLAYLFFRNNNSWGQPKELDANNFNQLAQADPYDEFGNAVAIDGENILVGAHTDEHDENHANLSLGINSGAVYFFEGTCDCAPYTVTPFLSAPICPNASNGAVNISTITGGVAPFTYIWTDSNGQPVGNTQYVSGLTAGNYTVVVTDANGCQATANSTIGIKYCGRIFGKTVQNGNMADAGQDHSTTETDLLKFNETANIRLMPNPTSGRFSIEFDGNYNNTIQIIILDISGKEVFNKEYNGSNRIDIHLEQPAGVYLLQIQSNHMQKSFKLIKE